MYYYFINDNELTQKRINITAFRKVFGWWKLVEFAQRYGINLSTSEHDYDTRAELTNDDQETADLFSEGTPDDDNDIYA
jgi:hypothetical protein